MAAFFDFPNEKIFSFPIEDFRPTARMSGAAPDRGMLNAWRAEGNKADCRAVLPKKRWDPDCFVCSTVPAFTVCQATGETYGTP